MSGKISEEIQRVGTSLRPSNLCCLETLFIAAVGGLSFQFLGVPAGLLSGSVLTVATAALAGRVMFVPTSLARAVLIILGISLGSVISPHTLQGLSSYAASCALLVLATLSMMAGTATYLRLVHRWDSLSALLGASPGAQSQVMALALNQGINTRAVAVAHITRLVLLTAVLPMGMMLLSIVPPIASSRQFVVWNVIDTVVLLGAALAGALVLVRVRFPGAWLIGSMVASGVLHGSGLISTSLASWVSSAAMIVLGAMTGSRFSGSSLKEIASLIGAALGSFAVSAAISAVFALVALTLLPNRAGDVVIAFAPGALDTMMLLAFALHLDPVFVGAHHFARFLLVSMVLPFAIKHVLRGSGSTDGF
jgi:membrane AbrB-like protein